MGVVPWSQGLPGKEDAFHHIEVLHEHVTLRLGAEVAHCVPDSQLDGTLQSGRGGLWGELLASDPGGLSVLCRTTPTNPRVGTQQQREPSLPPANSHLPQQGPHEGGGSMKLVISGYRGSEGQPLVSGMSGFCLG